MYQAIKYSKGLRYASCTLRSFLRLNVVGQFGVIRLHVWNLVSQSPSRYYPVSLRARIVAQPFSSAEISEFT